MNMFLRSCSWAMWTVHSPQNESSTRNLLKPPALDLSIDRVHTALSMPCACMYMPDLQEGALAAGQVVFEVQVFALADHDVLDDGGILAAQVAVHLPLSAFLFAHLDCSAAAASSTGAWGQAPLVPFLSGG